MRTRVEFPRNQTNQSDDIVPDDCYHMVYARDLYILQESRVTYAYSMKHLLSKKERKQFF